MSPQSRGPAQQRPHMDWGSALCRQFSSQAWPDKAMEQRTFGLKPGGYSPCETQRLTLQQEVAPSPWMPPAV